MTCSSLQKYCLFKVIKRLDLQVSSIYFVFTCEYVLFQLIFQRFQDMLSVWSQRTDASSLKNTFFFNSHPHVKLGYV
jgi:hypothetical protein